jgi:hypothetical protein
MSKQFKKGDVVWSIVNWNSKATVNVTQLTIQSWGKRQGTATSIKNGQPIKHLIYVGQDDHLFLASDVADVHQFALEIARQQKIVNIQKFVDGAHARIDSSFPGQERYEIRRKVECQELLDEEPTVLYVEFHG